MQASDQTSGAGGAPPSGQSSGHPAWAALIPAAIVAAAGAEPPVERLLTLQSAVARAVHMALSFGQIRPRLRRYPLLRFRAR